MTHRETLCPKAWTDIFISEDGAVRPCENFLGTYPAEPSLEKSFNSNYFNLLRCNMLKGRKIYFCNNCNSMENFGTESKRLSTYGEGLELENNIKAKVRNTGAGGEYHDNPENLIINLGYDNESSCRLSSAGNSEKTANEFKNLKTINKEFLNFENVFIDKCESSGLLNIENLLNSIVEIGSSLKRITISINSYSAIASCLNLIEELTGIMPCSQISLKIVLKENLKISFKENLLDNFLKVNFEVILMGVKENYEYIKDGFDWASFHNELGLFFERKKIIKDGVCNIKIPLNAYNILYLDEILVYIQDLELAAFDEVNFELSTFPKHTSLFAIPPNIINQIIDDVSKMNFHKEITKKLQKSILEILNIVPKGYNKSLTLEFIDYNNQIDTYRKVKMPIRFNQLIDPLSRSLDKKKEAKEHDITDLVQKGIGALENGNLSSANFFLKNISPNEISIDLNYEIGQLYFKLGEIKNVPIYFDECIQRLPSESPSIKILGWNYKEMKLVDKAFDVLFYRIPTGETGVLASICSSGWEELDDSRKDKLIEFYREFLKTSEDMGVCESLAHLLKTKDEFDESFDLLMRVYENNQLKPGIIDSICSGGWENLSVERIKTLAKFCENQILKGKSTVAIKTLSFILKTDAQILGELGIKKINKAYDLHIKFLDLKPKDEDIVNSLSSGGWNFLSKERTDDLALFCENQININKNITAMKTLSFIVKERAQRLGPKGVNMFSEAYELHRQYLEQFPNDEEVIESLCSGGWDFLGPTKMNCFIKFCREQIKKNNNTSAMKTLSYIQKKNAKKLGLSGEEELNEAFDLSVRYFNLVPDDQGFLKSFTSGGWDLLLGARREKLYQLYREQVLRKNHLAMKSLAFLLKEGDEHKDESFDLHFMCLNLDSNEEKILSSLLDGGWVNLSKERLFKLEEFYQTYLDKNLDSTKTMVSLALLYKYQSKKLPEAISLLKNVVDKFEINDYEVLTELSVLLHQSQEVEDAIKYLLIALKKDHPNNHENLRFLASLYQKNNETLNSINAYEKADSMESLNYKDLKLLGWLYKKEKNYFKAVKTFERILVSNPNDSDALDEVRRMTSGLINKFKMIFLKISEK